MAERGWPADSLVRAARDGDLASITALVGDSHPHVQRFAHALCATPEDAEDAAQEALIVLYRRIGTLRATKALASWLFRVVRNECLRRLRRPQPPSDDVVVSAETEVVRRLEAERVAAAVARLPMEQRRVLIMRDVQGYSGRATAAALGLSVAAMKSRLHRSRATVRQLLSAPMTGADDD